MKEQWNSPKILGPMVNTHSNNRPGPAKKAYPTFQGGRLIAFYVEL
jgi:hypothetical protein